MNTNLIDFANEHTFIFLGIGIVCAIILSFVMVWLYPKIAEGMNNGKVTQSFKKEKIK